MRFQPKFFAGTPNDYPHCCIEFSATCAYSGLRALRVALWSLNNSKRIAVGIKNDAAAMRSTGKQPPHHRIL